MEFNELRIIITALDYYKNNGSSDPDYNESTVTEIQQSFRIEYVFNRLQLARQYGERTVHVNDEEAQVLQEFVNENGELDITKIYSDKFIENGRNELLERYTDSNIQKEKDELIKYMELKMNEVENV